jgi:hypothetical protein
MPLDPAREWLAAGITGLARGREWDAVVLAAAPGTAGEEREFVALPDGRLLAEAGDATPFAEALAGAIAPPYRAVAVCRSDLWAVGARAIAVVELEQGTAGDQLELVRSAEGVSVRIDGMPSDAHLPELEALGRRARSATFVVRAQRLVEALFEIEVEPL